MPLWFFRRLHLDRWSSEARQVSGLVCFLFGAFMISILGAYGAIASDPGKTIGPNACAECHKQEVEAWKGTHHFKTFRNLPRDPEAKKIAGRMGVRRIKSDGLCRNCHYTLHRKDDKEEAIAGISCESCHGNGRDWIKVHSGYSGKTAKTETKAEAQKRWELAESKGMIRRHALYKLAKNCYGCHVVPQEDLVNKGGHRAGSAFELVSWSQGEVLHNTWYSRGKQNVPANAARKRMLYLVGLAVELETALRAVGKATIRKPYAFEMATRADEARKRLGAAAKAAPNVPEIAKMVELSHSASLKLNNERLLAAAADGISALIVRITEKYDGNTMAGLDGLIPPLSQFKGRVRPAAAVN